MTMSENYKILPFRFARFNDSEYLLTNDVGEYIFLRNEDFEKFINKELDVKSTVFQDLASKQIATTDKVEDVVNMLATKFRTKKSILRDFTSLHMVVPTLRCNSSCIYCQVARKNMDDHEADMTKKTAKNVVKTISEFTAIQANIERYNELISTGSDVEDSPEVIGKYGTESEPRLENWEDMQGDVEFEHITFTYPDGDAEVLTDFSLKIPKGSMVAIVGETGAGKTTLVNLVCRFYEPDSGRVLIDGRDIRERSAAWLHSHIGYVLQTPHLFSGTIRDNLRYAKPDATDEEIHAALEAVSALDIVEHLENGLDTPAGEGGNSLSTGQKQLISFARAVLSDPDILILDEATSSVDTITEKRIQSAIKSLTEGRTSFVIAHRLSTIVGADMIIAVLDGKIAEQGTHRELMEKRGYYYSLYTRQHEDIDKVL
mgnify:CR=1 FL=1